MAFIRKISPGNYDDVALLQLYRRNGDPELLAQLFDRHIEMLYAVCIKYLHDPEICKDAVMDIYEGLAAKLDKHDVSNFRAWIYTVAKNHCLMQLRSSSKILNVNIDEEHMQSAEFVHPESREDGEVKFTWLSSCMETLSPDQRRVIDLFYLQQKCYNEIVEITGFDWNKVRSLVQNGKRNLKICMEKEKQYEQK